MAYLKWLVPMTILYIMLTGNPELLNWGLGLILSIIIVRLIRPNPSPIRWSRLPKATYLILIFSVRLLWDLVASGIEVARLIVQPKPGIRQGIVAIPSTSNEVWVTTVSAEAITLTPGELVVEIGEDGTLFVHTLDLEKSLARSLKAQEARADQLEEIAL